MPARLTAGLLHQAERGALALRLPTGLGRAGRGRVLQIPTQEAPARLTLVCDPFWPCRSASQVVEACHTPHRRRPRRDGVGARVWQPPSVAAVLAILTHPADAGAFPSGRTRRGRREASHGPPLEHPPPPGAVASLPPRWVPSLQQLGDLSPDAGPVPRPLCRR
jgi:hypothetical protein